MEAIVPRRGAEETAYRSVLTQSGRKILDPQEAENVATHYQRVLERTTVDRSGNLTILA